MAKTTVRLIQDVEIFYQEDHPEQIEKAIALLKKYWACAYKGKNDVYGFEKKALIDVVLQKDVNI